MKIKNYSQSREQWLSEFDRWITPSLTEIKDKNEFRKARENISKVLELVGSKTSEYSTFENVEQLVEIALENLNLLNRQDSERFLFHFFNLLFMVSGKSDNNSKCQFPLYLRENFEKDGFPTVRSYKKVRTVQYGKIPRTIDSVRVKNTLIQLSDQKDDVESLLRKYVQFIMNEQAYINSLRSFGQGYYSAKKSNHHYDYLLPLVTFQIRGSLSAIGGHEPEEYLRRLMEDWGLDSNEDFNRTDHIIKVDEKDELIVVSPNLDVTQLENPIYEENDRVSLLEEEDIRDRDNDNSESKRSKEVKDKTRAYDFFLPLTSNGIRERILVQSQFYAGDSGSVSHKNVDQTKSSRAYIKKVLEEKKVTDYEGVKFVEYVDGAGYFSSLNSDLKKLLSMDSTTDIIQIRTAPLKLRRILQNIGLLTSIEIAHTIIMTDGEEVKVRSKLTQDGYHDAEIERMLNKSIATGLINKNGEMLVISSEYFIKARFYLLLDCIANYGRDFEENDIKEGKILIPGYSLNYGIRVDELQELIENTRYFKDIWTKEDLWSDILTLLNMGWLIIN